MEYNKQFPSFFLGANSSLGYYPLFQEWNEIKNLSHYYIIQGGTGAEKSYFMKNIVSRLQKKGFLPQLFFSASQDNLLDGFYLAQLGVVMANGNALPTMKQSYPGVIEEVISLGDYWDGSALSSHKLEILSLWDAISQATKNSYFHLSLAGKLREDRVALTMGGINTPRLEQLEKRLAKQIGLKPSLEKGCTTQRFLTGITAHGPLSLFSWLKQEGYGVIVLKDNYHIGSVLLKNLAERACEAGQRVILCPCALSPQWDMEHLLLPQKKLAFLSENEYHSYEGEILRTINLDRYMDEELIKLRRGRLRFDGKMMNVFLEKAVESLALALEKEKELAAFYESSMDFSALSLLEEKTFLEILAFEKSS